MKRGEKGCEDRGRRRRRSESPLLTTALIKAAGAVPTHVVGQVFYQGTKECQGQAA